MADASLLAIMLSPYPDQASCTLCLRNTPRQVGPELFLSDGRAVCWTCGREKAPELVALLEFAAAGRVLFGPEGRKPVNGTLVPVGNRGRLLNINEAAAYLGMSRRTLYTQIGLGQINTIKLGHKRMIDPSDLDEYVNTRRAKPWKGKRENRPQWMPG